MMNDLIAWVNSELNKRDWPNSRLADRAGVTGAAISHLLNRKTNPSFDICIGIAHAFNEQPEHVLRIAGLLPPLPEDREQEEALLFGFRSLSRERKLFLLDIVRGLMGTPSSKPDKDPPGSEQAFYAILEDLSNPDNPHRQLYDHLWDAARTYDEKVLLVRILVKEQARSYAFRLGAPVYMTTNGRELNIYQLGVMQDKVLVSCPVSELGANWKAIVDVASKPALVELVRGLGAE